MNRYKLSTLLIGISSLLIPAGARAFTPGEVAAKILAASPATRAESLGLSSLSESLKIEGNLPDPEIEGEYLFAPGDERDRWGAGISWGLDWPGVYAARRNETKGKMSAAEADVLKTRHDRLIEIKGLLLDYILAEKQLAVLKEIGAANDSIMSLSKNAERSGEMTRLDINKLRLEQASLSSNTSSLLNSRAETIAALNRIYGGDCDSLISRMTCEFPDFFIPADINVTQSPEVEAASRAAGASRGALKVADAEALPGLSVGYQHAFEDGTHFNGATLGISIPIFSSRHKKAAAKAALMEAEFKAEAAKASAGAEVAGAERRIVILRKQIEDMSPVVGDPDNTALLLKAYRGGIITLIDYLNERNYFTNATLELISLQHAAATLLLDIERHIPLR